MFSRCGDYLDFVDRPEALGEQRPGDIRLPKHARALDAPVDVALHVVDAGGGELVEIVMTTGGGDLAGAQAIGEFLRRQTVIAQTCGVEAVGLDFFIAQAGNTGEGPVDIGSHRGANREELQAHLVLAALRH